MNQQNVPNASTSADPPLKRKRGRPRKDGSLVKKDNFHNSPITPTPASFDVGGVKRNRDAEVDCNNNNDIDDEMVGQGVSGVIEGSFDAGYLISVRTGNSDTLLRGLVFQPGLFVPITASNDVAPQAKMCKRSDQTKFNNGSIATESKQNPQFGYITSPQTENLPKQVEVSTTTTTTTLEEGPKMNHVGPAPTDVVLGLASQPILPSKDIEMKNVENSVVVENHHSCLGPEPMIHIAVMEKPIIDGSGDIKMGECVVLPPPKPVSSSEDKKLAGDDESCIDKISVSDVVVITGEGNAVVDAPHEIKPDESVVAPGSTAVEDPIPGSNSGHGENYVNGMDFVTNQTFN